MWNLKGPLEIEFEYFSSADVKLHEEKLLL